MSNQATYQELMEIAFKGLVSETPTSVEYDLICDWIDQKFEQVLALWADQPDRREHYEPVLETLTFAKRVAEDLSNL